MGSRTVTSASCGRDRQFTNNRKLLATYLWSTPRNQLECQLQG